MRILVVEDDPAHSAAVEKALDGTGYALFNVIDGAQAVRFLTTNVVDLVILDWQMPKMSGFEVLHWIRAQLGAQPPVLFLTSKVLEVDIVLALEAGADEYVVKPFRLNELAARVKALLRRSKIDGNGTDAICIGGYTLDLNHRVLSFSDTPIDLTAKEFELVALLFNNVGRTISRDMLAKLAWGRELDISSRTIDTHIYRIRHKLSLSSGSGLRLTTVYTHGYRLDEVR
ncbi:response regulator transcription factor [Paraburkholderia susongensis]|uniref:DNA-binding response regulator, OmpR family, contains REC and winged-helix (WHTH) domain n=1 Tax=Paraburkholderia susongensis TaxID=1515439 RepID=A0A1X7M6K9_9BURK|nr:response regulator transcription factor [Paraburkholderia susongensis]SMG61153.1 DNA-binding response regulator, OmpR family, contains REC and winged-helix (wHTH) domain [Paraburkholderia susongensis]